MGEIADLMQDGTLCCFCGEYIGRDNEGYPSVCENCYRQAAGLLRLPKRFSCPQCDRRFCTENALYHHTTARHGDGR